MVKIRRLKPKLTSIKSMTGVLAWRRRTTRLSIFLRIKETLFLLVQLTDGDSGISLEACTVVFALLL